MKKQKANAQKVKDLSFGGCVMCCGVGVENRSIETTRGEILVDLCLRHAFYPDYDILDTIYNNAKEML